MRKRKEIIFQSITESEGKVKPKAYIPYQSDEESGKFL